MRGAGIARATGTLEARCPLRVRADSYTVKGEMEKRETALMSDQDVAQAAWRLAVGSGILGWVLDAFDFFVMVFLFDTLAQHFHVSKASMVYTLTLTLAMRPVGALFFGALADRFGRKRPLIFCVLYFSLLTVLTGLAPNYFFFVICRALYGIGMGGYWGIGASYAMESSPRRFRGVLSGMIQAGYPVGYLLAAVAMQTLAPVFGWRSVFFVGAPVAVLIVVLTLFAPESEAWKQHRPASMKQILWLTACSTRDVSLSAADDDRADLCLSHGAQDLYPDFLKSIPGIAAKTILGMNADLWHSDLVQRRRDCRRAVLWPSVAKDRPAQLNHAGAGDRAVLDSCVGLRDFARRAGLRVPS